MPRSPTAILEDADHAVEGMMQHSSSEANIFAHHDAQACFRTTRYFGVCDRMLVGLAILTIVRTSPALTSSYQFVPPGFQSVPSSFRAVDLPEIKSFSAAEFRPRGRSILEKDSPFGDAEDAPMLRGTTVWQRLKDYRSRDRVRVVTLWETGGGSVSLQAGRKGDPSLQWTSRLMNRGGATRGLLDHVLATSLGGVAHSLHLTPRAAGADAFGKPSKSAETVLGNGGAGTK